MNPMLAAFMAEIDREAAATRGVLARVPADKLEWQPHPKSMTLGQLALHVATVPGAVAGILARESLDVTTATFQAPAPQAAAGLVPALERSVAAAKDFLGGLGDSGADSTWRLTRGDDELMAAPRLQVVRTLMLNHWYHHRGQLAVYLRLLDVPLPAVYGRSADENPFAKP